MSLRPRFRIAWPVLVTCAACAALPGCAANKDELTQELSKMQTELSRLRAETISLGDRLEALEAAPGAPAQANSETKGNDRPSLAVVRLSPTPPDGASAAGHAEDEVVDEEPRLVLRADSHGASIDTGASADKPTPGTPAKKAPAGKATPAKAPSGGANGAK